VDSAAAPDLVGVEWEEEEEEEEIAEAVAPLTFRPLKSRFPFESKNFEG